MGAVCKTVQQHRERMDRLKVEGPARGIIYDEQTAMMPEQFIERTLILFEGEWNGKPFTLNEWQKEDLLRPLFGFKYAATNKLVFNEAYIQLPKGTGKSALNAAILLFYLLFLGKGMHLYCVGTSRETARTVFKDIEGFYYSSPRLKKFLGKKGDEEVTEFHTLSRPRSEIKYISADVSFDGPRPSCVSFDEYHKHRKSGLHDVFSESMTKLTQALMLTITNAGDNLMSPCYREYEKAKKVLAGSLRNDRYFAYVPEPDIEEIKADRVLTVEVLKKVSPNLGFNIPEANILQKLEDARLMPHMRHVVLRYHFNMWVKSAIEKWLNYEKWEACAEEYEAEDLYGCPIWLGIDMSERKDITAIVGLVEKAGMLYLLAWNFLPEARIRTASETEAPYAQWVEEGWVETCGKEVVDPQVLFEKIQWIDEHFKIRDIGIDRNRGEKLIEKCEEAEIPAMIVAQGLHVFSDPSKRFDELIYERQLRHNNNPCLNWQVGNAQIQIRGDLIKPMKEYLASDRRIDAVVSAIMALYVHDKNPDGDDDDFYGEVFNLPSNLRGLLGL